MGGADHRPGPSGGVLRGDGKGAYAAPVPPTSELPPTSSARPRPADPDGYTGVDNLEVMAIAKRYRRFLAGCVAAVAGPVRPGLSLLDFGAGTGTHARDIAALGYDVSCVELDAALQDRLRDMGFVTSASLDAVAPASHQVVYSFNVLEHIDDDATTVARLAEVTAPGGSLVLYVPAMPALWSSMARKVGHVRRYRRPELEQLVSGAGLVIRKSCYVDVLGAAATLAYKVVGNDRGDISEASVGAYDRWAFPVSRALDRVTGRLLGKNLLVVAERPSSGAGGS